jgi:hypothetical protein
MTAKTIHLASSDTKASAHSNDQVPDAVGFVSMCPNCKDARCQRGYSFRTLVTFLVSDQPVEAYCPVCNDFWPIDANERSALAWMLLTD